MFFLSWYVSTHHHHHQTTHISQLKTLGKGQKELVEMQLERRVFTNLWYYIAKQDLSLGFGRVGDRWHCRSLGHFSSVQFLEPGIL